jgi:pimeloyl-ACP methyl ester carboxylesterase
VTVRRIVLIHGVATSHRVWRELVPYLTSVPGLEVRCPERPASGDLDTEIDALREVCAGAVVVGVSGGATLGLELASRGTPILAGIFHEPAAGSLAPGLLAHVAEGLRSGGVEGFGRALYGPSWPVEEVPPELETVAREFAMFGRFEPAPLDPAAGPVLFTVGELSPAARLASVQALSTAFDRPWASVPGGTHAVHLECPGAFSTVILDHIRQHLD